MPFFAAAFLTGLIGIVIAGPGVVYVTSGMNRPMAPDSRYATYDPELYLCGIAITPATAHILAFGLAPLLIALSAFFVFRGARNCHLIVDSIADTD
jgi:hypothetical protein